MIRRNTRGVLEQYALSCLNQLIIYQMKKNILIAFIVLGLIGMLCSLWLMLTAQDVSDFRLSYMSLFGWGIVFGASAIAECETN